MYGLMDFDNDGGELPITDRPYLPEAADCMRCGVCLSVCPTYKLGGDEKQGPRSRVNSLRRLLQQGQTLDAEDQEQLQSCVQCRACESVCPSRMDYAVMFDRAGERLAAGKRAPVLARAAFFLIAHKALFNSLLPLVGLYRRSGLRALLRKSKLLVRTGLEEADRLAGEPALHDLRSHYPVLHPRGCVALFTGCVTDRFDRRTLLDAIAVLNRIGYDVLVPGQQNCCGAIHCHNGRQREGLALMRRNAELFDELPVSAIVYCATGCGSQLQEYAESPDMEEADAARHRSRLFEIGEFVARNWPEQVKLNACRSRIRVHEPCSQRNVLKNAQWLRQLLARIPQAEIRELDDNQLCCGAGGSYLLTHPDNAAALAGLKWRALRRDKPNVLLTTNFGCALHLRNAREASDRVSIMHPISLIAGLLEYGDGA